MYLPLLFNTDNMNCLVVGGGEVAFRKIEVLLNAGCHIVVIAPEMKFTVADLASDDSIDIIQREYESGDCKGRHLVIAATGDRDVNRQVSEEARKLGIPVNVVDKPDLCTVIFPAVLRDEPLVIAVSTSGKAPFMAPELRNRLKMSTEEWSRWVQVAARFRQSVLANVIDVSERRTLYKKFADKGVPDKEFSPPIDNDLKKWLVWLGEDEPDNE